MSSGVTEFLNAKGIVADFCAVVYTSFTRPMMPPRNVQLSDGLDPG